MVATGLILSAFLVAQAAPPRQAAPARPAAPPQSDVTALALGWSAVGARQYDEAVKAADGILRRRPWDRAAQVLKIQAASGASASRGLDAYEEWLQRVHAEDAAMLEPVAIAVLQELANGSRRELQRPALRALVAARVSGARESLDAAKTDVETQMDLDVQAARAGDRTALENLQTQARAPMAPPSLAKAFAELGASAGEPGLLLLARSTNPRARQAAVDALGGIKTESARAAAAQLQKDADPGVRTSATIALARMEDPAALDAVDRMLATNIPDVQILAARAFEGRPGAWVSAIRPLLDNRDGLTRLDAARAIAPVDPDAARQTLDAALGDPNPVVRADAATSLEEIAAFLPAGNSIATLRQRLRDTDPAVRLAVAGALLRLARQ